MNGKDLLKELSFIEKKFIEESECARPDGKITSLPRRKVWLIAAAAAALLLAGCTAAAVALRLFESPKDMVEGLYGGNSAYQQGDPVTVTEEKFYDGEMHISTWKSPGYEKRPVDESAAAQLEQAISPVGQVIERGGYKLTVDAYVYDSETESGFITCLVESPKPIAQEDLYLQNNGELGNTIVYFNQYGRAYYLPEKSSENQLAFTYYFHMDIRKGAHLVARFPEMDARAQADAREKARTEYIQARRPQLMEEMTEAEAVQMLKERYGSGEVGQAPYDCYYFLSAYEFDKEHPAEYTSDEDRQRLDIRQRLETELTPEEAEAKLRQLWGSDLVDETFVDRPEEIPFFAYSILADLEYETNNADKMLVVDLQTGDPLTAKTFGKGDAYLNSLTLRLNEERYSDGADPTVILRMADGSTFVVRDDNINNALFYLNLGDGCTLQMLNSAINIEDVVSVEIRGNLSSAVLEAD